MYDSRRLTALLDRIAEAITLVMQQTSSIGKPDDFLCSPTGMFVLGGVCMQLIFVGETVKVIDGKFPDYLGRYSAVPWKDIMGLRDIIAHEYHHVDAEEIFAVLKDDLPHLLEVIHEMQKNVMSDLKGV